MQLQKLLFVIDDLQLMMETLRRMSDEFDALVDFTRKEEIHRTLEERWKTIKNNSL